MDDPPSGTCDDDGATFALLASGQRGDAAVWLRVRDLGDAAVAVDELLDAAPGYGIEIGPDGQLWVAEIATPGVYRLDPA